MDTDFILSPTGLRSPERYIAIHEFTTSREDEINLVQGDVVLVVKKYKDGWFRGVRCRGYKVGCFPGNFVRIDSSSNDRTPFTFDLDTPPPLPAKKEIRTARLIDLGEEGTSQTPTPCPLSPLDALYPPDSPSDDLPPPELPEKTRSQRTSIIKSDANQNTSDETCVETRAEVAEAGPVMKIGNGLQKNAAHRNSTHSQSSFMGLKMLQDNDTKYAEDSDERKRTRAAEELLTSEISYFSGLTMLISNYLTPLRERHVISEEDLKKIFSNVESLALISKEMVSKLQSRLAKWDVHITRIGDALLEMFSYLKLFEPYFNSRNKGNEMKAKLEKSNEKFRVISCRVISGQTLNSLLLMPIQRIPRYALLLKELVKRTDKDHPDYENLKEAQAKAQKAAADLNEHIRRIENESKLIEVMKSFPNDELNLIHAATSHAAFVRTFGSGRIKKHDREQLTTISKKLKRMSLPLAGTIERTSPHLPRSATASPIPGIREHDNSDSDSDSEPPALPVHGDKFVTSVFLYEGAVERVTRKATGSSDGGMVHETVERYLFLFDNVLLISVASDNLLTGRRTFKLKNDVPLSQSWVANTYTYYTNPPETMFLVGTPLHIYKFLAASVREKEVWERELNTAIGKEKDRLMLCFKGLPLPDEQFTAITVEAKIDYNKTADVELNLRQGEEVLVVGVKTESGHWHPGLYQDGMFNLSLEWWPGIQKGKFGWLPAQCVTGPDSFSLSSSDDEIHPIPTAVALNLIQNTMRMWTGSKSIPVNDVKVVKVYRPDKTFKTCKVESDFLITDALRQYTSHKSFCKAEIDIDTLELWEESIDGSVHRLLPRNAQLGEVIGVWGKYRPNMKLVIRVKGETRAGSKTVLDM